MTEYDPSQGRLDEPLTGKISGNKVAIPSNRETGYDPLDTAETYKYLSSEDHAAILANQDNVARDELTRAIREKNSYHHTSASHARLDAPSGVRPDQAAAMKTARNIRKNCRP
jgi:hypothetical protein